MDLMLNSLPTRTWNRLGMNETKVSMEGEFNNHTPQAQWDPAEVLWTPDAQGAHIPFPGGAAAELEALTDGAKVALAETKAGVTMAAPLVLTYAYDAGEKAASRLVLHAEKGSVLEVVLLLKSNGGGDVSAIQTEVYAEEDAAVKIHVAELLGDDSVCMYNLGGVCADRARVDLVKLELGAAKLYAGARIDLAGKESAFNTWIGYHARENQLLDMNYVALHRGKNTTSFMEVSGTMEEHAKKIFRGTIDFRKGCAGAKGDETENVLLLGENMVNQTIPLILCKEEDVEGNHGASIGRLDERVLFYLGSRGISQEMAQKIIAQSRIEAVCARIPVEEVRNQVHDFEDLRGMSDEQTS